MKDNHPRKTIAIFSGYFLPFLGGIERYTDKLSGQLVELGYRVIIITSNHDNLAPVEYDGDRSIYRLPVYNLFKNRYPIIRKNSEYRHLIEEAASNDIDYYICNTRFQLTTFVGVGLAKKHKKQAIVLDHGSSHFSVGVPVLDYFGKIYEHILTSLLKRDVERFYGVSKRCCDWLKHFGITAAGVFYNAVDASAYDNFKNSKYMPESYKGYETVVSYAGRIMKEKGVEMLLKSFTELDSRIASKSCLIIAGDGPYLEEARGRFKQSNIFFTGKLDYSQIMSLFNSTDIFCYPSMYPEGLPTSILEAGIMGCAVIATDRGGTKEVINNQKLGIIIDENNASLGLALERLLLDKELTKQLGDGLRKRVQQSFTWAATAREVQRAFKGGSQ